MSFMCLLHDIYHLACSQSQPVRATLFPFKEQLGRVYTPAVFKEYKETYFSSTAFRVRADTTRDGLFLVSHGKQSTMFMWSEHDFNMVAEEETGTYSCECKRWEHTCTFTVSRLVVTVPSITLLLSRAYSNFVVINSVFYY